MATGKFLLQGMKDPKDAERVNQALRNVWGVQEVAMQPDKAEVTFQYDERAATYEDFKQAVLDCGYGVVNGRHGDGERL